MEHSALCFTYSLCKLVGFSNTQSGWVEIFKLSYITSKS